MSDRSDAVKAIHTLDQHIAAAAPGSAEATALAQVRYRFLTDSGLNGVDDVDAVDPDGKPPTKAANKSLSTLLQAYVDESENAGQAAPFEMALSVVGGDEGADDD